MEILIAIASLIVSVGALYFTYAQYRLEKGKKAREKDQSN